MIYTEKIKKTINSCGFEVIEYKQFCMKYKALVTNIVLNLSQMTCRRMWDMVKEKIVIFVKKIKNAIDSIKQVEKITIIKKRIKYAKTTNFNSTYGKHITKYILKTCRSNC